MQQRELAIILGITFSIGYLVALGFINRMEDVKLTLNSYDPQTVLKALDGYDFTGDWLDSSNRFNKTIKTFENNEGKASMRLYYDNPVQHVLKSFKTNLAPEFAAIVRLSEDGQNGKNKFIFKLSFNDLDPDSKEVVNQRKFPIYALGKQAYGKFRRMRFRFQV